MPVWVPPATSGSSGPRSEDRLVAFVAVLAIVGLCGLGYLGVQVLGRTGSLSGSGAAGGPIRCDPVEQLAVHYHTHLSLYVSGRPVAVPALIGIPDNRPCIYWVHTHDTSGIIHLELPFSEANRTFTMNDFLNIYGQPLSALLGPGSSPSPPAWLDGKPYRGSIGSIPLRPHGDITIESGAPAIDPPPAYRWPQGF